MIPSTSPSFLGIKKGHFVNGLPCAHALLLLSLVCGACRSTPEWDQKAAVPENAVSFDQCDIDIRPRDRIANPAKQLHVEYAVEKAGPKGMSLRVEMTAAGFALYDQANVKLQDLAKNTPYKVDVYWTDVEKEDTVNVSVEANPAHALHSGGGWDGTEPDFSPSFERDKSGEFVRIRCRFRGRSTFLIVK